MERGLQRLAAKRLWTPQAGRPRHAACSAQVQLNARTLKCSLAPQRSAGRGLGRGDFQPNTSPPQPSPPASLGSDGDVSVKLWLNASSIALHAFRCASSAHAQQGARIPKSSLATQRSAGRGLGRGVSQPNVSSSQLSPPASLGREGDVSVKLWLNASSIALHAFRCASSAHAQQGARIPKSSLATQRSAGRGLGRGVSQPNVSSSQLSPPASLGREGDVSVKLWLNASSIALHAFRCASSAHAQQGARIPKSSLATQRSAGRGLGRGVSQPNVSSSQLSPPASLGREGDVSVNLWLNASSIALRAFRCALSAHAQLDARTPKSSLAPQRSAGRGSGRGAHSARAVDVYFDHQQVPQYYGAMKSADLEMRRELSSLLSASPPVRRRAIDTSGNVLFRCRILKTKQPSNQL